MPHIEATHVGRDSVLEACTEYRLEFAAEELKEAHQLVWVASSFSDPGPDYNIFRLEDKDGDIIAIKRMEGF